MVRYNFKIGNTCKWDTIKTKSNGTLNYSPTQNIKFLLVSFCDDHRSPHKSIQISQTWELDTILGANLGYLCYLFWVITYHLGCSCISPLFSINFCKSFNSYTFTYYFHHDCIYFKSPYMFVQVFQVLKRLLTSNMNLYV